MGKWENKNWINNMKVQIDLNNIMSEKVGESFGLTPDQFAKINDITPAIHEELTHGRQSGELGFYLLPYDVDTPLEVKNIARDIRSNFKNLVVLGIGGSALGTMAIQRALVPPFGQFNEKYPSTPAPKVFVVDNVDPDHFYSLLQLINVSETCFVVISKSGTTAETMSQFMIVHELIKKLCGEASLSSHIIAITDSERGYLREISLRENYRVLPVPGNVGGRFSVLTAVGLLPSAVMGIDIDELLAGAKYMEKRCNCPYLFENPAYYLGAAYFLADTNKGQHIHVFMPYSNSLYGIADWLRQLIAESLGKRYDLDGKEVFIGPTPIKALGATDQHSQLQLYMEGPRNKIITFFRVNQFKSRVNIPSAFPNLSGVNYLGGKTLSELINAEQEATAIALTEHGRSNITVLVPEINPFTIGQIFFLFEVMTVFMGKLYNINPLDQPGVETSKQNTYAIMGRPGFEERAKQIHKESWSNPDLVI